VNEELLQPDEITADFVPRQRAGLSAIEIEGEGLVYDETSNAWHLLNPTGYVVWLCCDGNGTVEEIAQDVSSVFQQDIDAVRSGVLDAVRELGRQGLLEGVSGTHHQHASAHEGHGHVDEEGSERRGESPRFLPNPAST